MINWTWTCKTLGLTFWTWMILFYIGFGLIELINHAWMLLQKYNTFLNDLLSN